MPAIAWENNGRDQEKRDRSDRGGRSERREKVKKVKKGRGKTRISNY
jgi:hypothetical protein